ncbi:MAG: MFS transporter [Phycisphaerales bacterium]
MTSSRQRRPLWNAGFISLFATQYFEAASDNVIKGALGFAVGLGGPWADRLGDGGQGLVSFLFTVPFVVLSAFGGRLADRYSKRTSTVALKTVSLGVAVMTLIAFRADSATLAIAALVLFAIVSSFFGPVKYGMIAELVDEDQLVHANGLINVGTNLAVISGTVLAGVVATAFADAHESAQSAPTTAASDLGFWVPGLAMCGLAFLGWMTCLTLPRLKPQSPDLPLDPNPFSTYWQSIRGMASGPLLAIAIAWTFFYFLAAFVLAALADYPKLLGVTPLKASVLSAAMGVAIGVGCVTAAWLCGKRARLGFVPLGAAGLAAAFLALGIAPLQYWLVGALLSGMGLVAGFYIIPLQAALQQLAPNDQRGRFLGTANAMSFVMGGVGALLFWALGHAGMPTNRMFIVLAVLTLVAGVMIHAWVRRNRERLADATATLAAPGPSP